jgi:hypothetical protein
VKNTSSQTVAWAFWSVLLLSGGCVVSDDSRLQGTWKSDREATVAAVFAKDPRWTNASPEHIGNFTNMFGQMILTYSNYSIRIQRPALTATFSNGMEKIQIPAVDEMLKYRVVQKDSNSVVIRPDSGLEKGQKIRIRFVDGGNGYWTETMDSNNEEKFDRISTHD